MSAACFDIRQLLNDNSVEFQESESGDSDHGTQIVIDCPLCRGRRKLYVSESGGQWCCFKCSERGDFRHFIMAVTGLDELAAMRMIAEDDRYFRSPTLADIKRKATVKLKPATSAEPIDLPDGFQPVFDGGRWHLHPYLAERGIAPGTAAAYGLGFCRSGNYRGMMVMPCYVDGKVRYWLARSTRKKVYLNAEQGKAGVVFGFDQAQGRERLVLVEGAIDALGVYQAGERAVALLGKVISEAQISTLRRLRPKEIVILLDPEARADAIKVYQQLVGKGSDVRVAQLPEYLVDEHGRRRLDADGKPIQADPGNSPPEVIARAIEDARPISLRELMQGRPR